MQQKAAKSLVMWKGWTGFNSSLPLLIPELQVKLLGDSLIKGLGGSWWPRTYGAVDLQSSSRDDPVKAKNR